MPVVRSKTPIPGYDPSTIFNVDPTTKSVRPYGSGDAFTEGGFKFGQEELVDSNYFQGFSFGPVINSVRSTGLNQVTQDLNKLQADTFASGAEPSKRKSSALTDKIAEEESNLNTYLAEFNDLRKKLTDLQAPNYQQAFTDARTSQGVPQLEQDFLGVRQTRRELPFTERAATGNAAVATEGQLQEQTTQKDIPLEAREANLIDRLKLASDFVNNSVRLKELDTNAARQGLADAITLVGDTINLSRTTLGDLFAKQDREQARSDTALQFRLDNNIQTPFFNVGGTIFDAGSMEGIPTEAEFQTRYGMSLAQAEAKGLVSVLNPGQQEERALVADLITKFPDARIKLSGTLDQAQSKLSSSPSYRKAISTGDGSGTDENFGYTLSLRKEFDQQSRNFLTIRDSYSRLLTAKDQNSAAGDIALIFSYMKLLDPTSVVREGEFATAQNAGSIDSKIRNAYNKAINGERLQPSQRTDFIDTAGQIYVSQLDFQNRLRDEFRATASGFGLDPIKVAPDLGAGIATPTSNKAINSEIADLQSSGVISGSSPEAAQGGLVKKVLNFFGL